MNNGESMDKVSDFVKLPEVSSIENGGKILFATDDFFAAAENLLKREEPIWNEEYTEFGKWMDGWETRRKRIAGHDWTIIELGRPSMLRGICVDTAFFTGNYAPRFSLQGANSCQGIKGIQNRKNKMGTAANNEELEKMKKLHSENWKTLIPMTSLQSGDEDTRKHYFELNTTDCTYKYLRFNIFPDGGVARLRVYGKPSEMCSKPINGGCYAFSNAHYGHPNNLLKSWPSEGMHDGWETARRMDRPPMIDVDDTGFMKIDGEEWAVLILEKSIFVNRIEVDTTHFKGNCPDNVKIEGAFVKPGQDLGDVKWNTVLKRTKLMPNQSNGLKDPFVEATDKPINHVKVIIAPDGGIARIRIYGYGCEA